MILGYVADSAMTKGLHPLLQQAVKYIRETDFAQLASGRHEIQGDSMYAMVSRYLTKPKKECRPEAHEKYIDVQYLVSGQELIGYAPKNGQYEVESDWLEDKDVVLFKAAETETDIRMQPGIYAVFFPWDVHRPCCSVGVPEEVVKVVIKIKYCDVFGD